MPKIILDFSSIFNPSLSNNIILYFFAIVKKEQKPRLTKEKFLITIILWKVKKD
jgi:hypothetical protein